jgi:predicted GNAT family acetyltransferase
MALFQLVYMSSLRTDDAQSLPAILAASVRNNKKRSLTGMILYADGSILQVLEGEKDVVLQTFGAIQSDVRHRGLLVLIEADIATRQFSSWSMGFRHLTADDLKKIPGAAPIFMAQPDEIATRVRPSDALTLLTTFAQDAMSQG